MPIGSYMLRLALSGVALATLGGSPTLAQAQADICSSPDRRQACSFQCCGRRSCPPSCEIDCVKVCVDACASPERTRSLSGRMRDLQIRCGNKAPQ
jgi:hypothetical protein